MEPSTQSPELVQSFPDVVAHLLQQRLQARRIRISEPLGQLEIDGERDQVLLRPVVELPLDLASLGVRSGDQPRPGCAELLDSEAQVVVVRG
jgi:hypothetical protein